MKRFAIVTTACAAVALGMTFSAGSAHAGGGTVSGQMSIGGANLIGNRVRNSAPFKTYPTGRVGAPR